ncbi:MAG: DUF6527 family protein [Rhodanobacter sp.]
MSRAKIVTDDAGRFFGVRITCPGCVRRGMWHVLETDWMPDGMERSPGARADRWGFNGDLECPTFTPSLLIRSEYADPPVTPENYDEWKANPWPQTKVPHVCHSFIRNGRIEFLGDCTHDLAGQIVDLPDIEGEGD